MIKKGKENKKKEKKIRFKSSPKNHEVEAWFMSKTENQLVIVKFSLNDARTE